MGLVTKPKTKYACPKRQRRIQYESSVNFSVPEKTVKSKLHFHTTSRPVACIKALAVLSPSAGHLTIEL